MWRLGLQPAFGRRVIGAVALALTHTRSVADAAGEGPLPGVWKCQEGAVYSELCEPCATSEDTALAALQRQFLLAGPDPCSEQPRLFIGSLGGDIKGLQQLLGTAGASATYFCMFCQATLNGTLKAGVPHLRDLPSP